MESTTHNRQAGAGGGIGEILKPAVAIWFVLTLVGGAVYLVFPSPEDHPVGIALTRSVGVFVACVAFFVGKRTKKGEGRTLAFLYSLFFSIHAVFGLTMSFGATRLIGIHGIFQAVQYENLLHNGSMLLVCAYIIGGAVFPGTKQNTRLVLATFVVAMLIGPASMTLATNANYLHTLPDITDFRAIDRATADLRAEGLVSPGPGDVAERVSLSRWEGLRRLGELEPKEELARIGELFPFLEGNNYVALVNRPLYERYAFWSMAGIGLLAAFFVLNFLKDPPKPAHFEKIHFTLLAYAIFEYFHALTLANATSFEDLVALDQIGKYVTAAILVLFACFFLARARFLSMGVGMFYEDKLTNDPQGISRWRDGIDNLLLRVLYLKPTLRSRFLSRLSEKR